MGQAGSLLLEPAFSVVSLLTLQKRAMNAPSEPYGSMRMAGAMGPEKAYCQLAMPATVMDHCWSAWLALSLALDLHLVFVLCFSFTCTTGRKYFPHHHLFTIYHSAF